MLLDSKQAYFALIFAYCNMFEKQKTSSLDNKLSNLCFLKQKKALQMKCFSFIDNRTLNV